MSFPTFSFKPSKNKETASNRPRSRDERADADPHNSSKSRLNRSTSRDHHASRSGGLVRPHHPSRDRRANRFRVLENRGEDPSRIAHTETTAESKTDSRLYFIDTKGDSLNEQLGYHHPSSTPRYKRYTSYILGDKLRRVRNVIGDDGHVLVLDGPEFDYSPELPLSNSPLNLFAKCFSDHEALGDVVSLENFHETDTLGLVVSELLKKRVELQKEAVKSSSNLETWLDLLAVEEQLQVEQKCPADQSAEIMLPLISDCLSNLSHTPKTTNEKNIRYSALPRKIKEMDLIMKDIARDDSGFFDSTTWKNMALSYPFVAELWENWIDSYIREHGPQDREKLGYLQAFIDLQQKEHLSQLINDRIPDILANGKEDALHYIFARIVAKITSMMKDAGHFEFAISIAQLLIERNFFQLQLANLDEFKEYWETEAPRFGDMGAEGLLSAEASTHANNTIVPRTSWPAFENFHSFTGNGVDAFSVVFFDDISDYATVEGQYFNHYLLFIFFNLLGCNISSFGACATYLSLDDYHKFSKFAECALSQMINLLPKLIGKPARISSVLQVIAWTIQFFAEHESRDKVLKFVSQLTEETKALKTQGGPISWEISALITEIMLIIDENLAEENINNFETVGFEENRHWQNVKLRLNARLIVHGNQPIDGMLFILKKTLRLSGLDETICGISVLSILEYMSRNLAYLCNTLEYETLVALTELTLSYAGKAQCDLGPIRQFLRRLGGIFYESVEIHSLIIRFQCSHGIVYDDMKEKHGVAFLAAYYLEHGAISPEIHRYLLKNYRLPANLFLVSMGLQSVKTILRFRLCYKANIHYLNHLMKMYKTLDQPERIKDLQKSMDLMLIRWRLFGPVIKN